MSVLGNLFSDIATAIRIKTGEDGTMKPTQFPEKIRGIVLGVDSAVFDSVLDEINGEVVGELVVSSGACGSTASYMLNDGGLLKITGSGAITSTPWKDHEDAISRLVIADGITVIPQQSFASCGKLHDVSLGSGLTEIGMGAFNGCKSLLHITIPAAVATIRPLAFGNCGPISSMRFEDTVGWKVFKTTGELVAALGSADLANPATAAARMADYSGHQWTNT